MYNIGEYISYGNNGVCEIVGTETMDSSMENVDSRQCYILRPLHDRSCKIMTPVDNQKVIMRKLISKEETRQLLDDIVPQGDAWLTLTHSPLLSHTETILPVGQLERLVVGDVLGDGLLHGLGIDKGETKELLINAFGQ